MSGWLEIHGIFSHVISGVAVREQTAVRQERADSFNQLRERVCPIDLSSPTAGTIKPPIGITLAEHSLNSRNKTP